MKRNFDSKLMRKLRTVLELSSANNNHEVHKTREIRGFLSGTARDSIKKNLHNIF